MSDLEKRIADNVAEIEARIAASVRDSGRDPGDVTLVAVTKYVGPPEIEALLRAGVRNLGESRPQLLWQRAAEPLLTSAQWHLVGHLQRNKVRRTLPIVTMIHSADSLRLIEAIETEAASAGRPVTVLLEVNVSGDPTKHGFVPDALEALLAGLAKLEFVQVRGLMAMASRSGGPQVARENFAQLRQLRDRLRDNCPEAITLDELSMGMSGDFEPAIAEGATLVRVGSALFKGVVS